MEKNPRMNKDEYIYSLKYKEQIVYYFNDSFFENENPSEIFKEDEYCKVSELNEYIEEFSKYLSKDYYHQDGIIKINYTKIKLNMMELYTLDQNFNLMNKGNYAVKIFRKLISENEDRDEYNINIELRIDLTKDTKQIIENLKTLDEKTNYFNIKEFIENLNLNFKNNNFKNFAEYISSERLFMMKKDEYAFITIEYCHLRKYMKLDEINAQKCLKKIYNFEK